MCEQKPNERAFVDMQRHENHHNVLMFEYFKHVSMTIAMIKLLIFFIEVILVKNECQLILMSK